MAWPVLGDYAMSGRMLRRLAPRWSCRLSAADKRRLWCAPSRAAMLGAIVAVLVAASSSTPALAQATPTIAEAFAPTSIGIGGTTSLTFTLSNPDPLNPAVQVRFIDSLPAGLMVATPNGLTGTCLAVPFVGATVTAAPGDRIFDLSGDLILDSASSCTISVNVTGTTAGTKTNAVTVTATGVGGRITGNTATATLQVVAPAPTISTAFGAASVPLGGSTSLSFTITNAASTTITGVAFTDTFPAGLVVATPNGLSGSCGGGTITATAGGSAAGLSGASLAASASCTFSLNVTATSAGAKVDTTSPVSSNEASSGSPATASLIVAAATTAALTSSANPSFFGQAVTFTATVTGASPTGTVTFKDGATVLGSGTLNGSGVATFTTPSLAVGSHSITAAYAGDANNSPSTSAVLTQSVNVPADSVKLRALQLEVTRIEAQGSGQAISGAIDGAISDGFSENGSPISGGSNGMHFNFAAAPQEDAQERAQKRVSDAFAALGYARDPMLTKAPPRAAPKEWLAWADVRGTNWSTSTQTGDIRGGQSNGLIGLTRKLTPDVLVGAFGGYEIFDYTSQLLDGRLKGEGWTAGGYLGWHMLPGLRFDAGVARSGISYDGVAGTASGTFPGQRWLATAALVGTYRTMPGFEIEPSARVYALWEHDDAYTDTLGTLQTERTFSTGRASAGTKVAYPWMWSATTTVAPYVGVYADYYFNQDDAALPVAAPLLLPTEFISGWSARVTSGIAVSTAAGPKLSVGGELGGLGSNQFTLWSVRGQAALPF
jgi:uncharacterized repeat protein (TIGR01451 family)